MGTIADKLLYLDGTKTALREAINLAGGNVADDAPFRQYANWVRKQSASLSLDFVREEYIARNATNNKLDRFGFGNIITFTRASGGGRFNAAGVYELVANDVPRFDYDPVTLAPRGILIEGARTNLLQRSSEFSDAYWAKTGVVVAANATTSPDGTAIADFLGENTSTGVHNLAVVGMGSAGAHTFTCYAKAGSRTWLVLRAETINTYFNLAAGTVGTVGAGITASIEPVKDGWYRCRVTKTFGAATAVVLRLATGDGVDSYTGDGTSGIYIWGAQLEAGAFPTSYIPTVASQVTRSADVASVNTLSPWYNASEGTIVVEANIPNPIGATNHHIFGLSDGTTSNFVTIRKNPSNLQFVVTTAGVTEVNIQMTSPTGAFKAALSLQSNNTAAAFGGVVNTDSSNTVPPPSVLHIGSLAGAGQYANGHIQSIEYYPRRLSNTELQEITA